MAKLSHVVDLGWPTLRAARRPQTSGTRRIHPILLCILDASSPSVTAVKPNMVCEACLEALPWINISFHDSTPNTRHFQQKSFGNVVRVRSNKDKHQSVETIVKPRLPPRFRLHYKRGVLFGPPSSRTTRLAREKREIQVISLWGLFCRNAHHTEAGRGRWRGGRRFRVVPATIWEEAKLTNTARVK